MKNLWLILTLIFCFNTTTSAAEQVSCKPYLGQKDNLLVNAGLVGGNSNDLTYKNSDEIFLDKEIKKNKYWFQYFYLTQYHNYKKILLGCIYKDGNSTIKEIPKVATVCVRIYPPDDQKTTSSSIIGLTCY